MRMIQRAGGLLLAAATLLGGILPVAAAEGKQVSDWINLPGYTSYDGPQGTKQRNPTPATISRTADGIRIDCDGYYKVGVEAFSGLIYKEKLDIEGLSFEILLNEVPGVDSSGGGTDDLWLSFAFLDRPEMFFSQTTDKGGKGLVTNLRPGKRDILNQMFTHINDPGSSQGWKTLSSATIKTDPPAGSRLAVEFRKQGSYINLYINGKKQANVWSQLMSQTFPDKKGYLAIATSTDTAKTFSITVTQLNGVKLGDGTAATPSKTDGTTAPTKTPTDPTKAPTKGSSSGTTGNGNGTTRQDPTGGPAPTQATGGTDSTPDTQDSQSAGETAAPTYTVPAGAEKVELSEAIRSGKAGVSVDADKGTIGLNGGMTMAELRGALTLADGYRFVFYDINNQEIRDESAEVTVLTNAILYFGSDVEKIFTFDLLKQINNESSGNIWWIWLVAGVVVLAGAGAAVYFLIIRKKKAGGPQ